MTPPAIADGPRAKRPLAQILVLSAGLLILIGVSASAIYLVFLLREDGAEIAHTLEVENQISIALLQMRRAESAERGYLLTGRQEFLAEYREAEAAIRPAYEQLEKLIADNPIQVALLARALPLVDRRLSEFNDVISMADRGRRDDAMRIVDENAVRRTMPDLRDIARAMRDEEERLLVARTAEVGRTQILSAVAVTTGSGAVLALALTSMLLVQRSHRRRDQAEMRLRDLNANLEAAIDERTADLTEANQEIQRFAYIVSHDLRSPLVNIMGFTSELEELRNSIFRRIAELSEAQDPAAADDAALSEADRALAREFDESLGFIKSSIGKMDRLIAAILTLNREGRREFKPETIDVRQLIQSIAETVAHQAEQADAIIRVEPLPPVVSDRLALDQIFGNLIDNALKYLRTGVPGEIHVRGRQKTGYIVYEVTDNGRGIDQKDHQRIFDLFRRAGAQDRPGQGIGLAHVRALVRRMGGTLSVSSEPGEGSTFTVMLPARWTLPLEGKTT